MMLFAQGDAVGLIGYLLAAFATLAGVVAFLFKMLMTSKDASLADLKAENSELKSKIKSLESIADEGHETALTVANWYRNKHEGKAEIVPIVKVVPEANSPPTEIQILDASIATHRAGLAEIRLAVGLPPRTVPENGSTAAPAADYRPTLMDALDIKEQIARVPEQTAAKVVEKIKETT